MTKIAVKIDNNNTIKSYGIYIDESIKPLADGIDIETDINFDDSDINLVNNYKLVDGALIELTEEEKAQVSTS